MSAERTSTGNDPAVDDPDNPIALKIIAMADKLGIDPQKECYLLAIAKHAVESPEDFIETIDGETEGATPDITWFSKLVTTERERFEQNPVEASPWLKLTDGDDSYYYNFQTKQRAKQLPGYKPRHRLESPAVTESDLEVMKFTSWWMEHGKKKYVHVSYFMKTEDFEINIEEDSKLYRMKTLKGPQGPLGCWDLHVNASINVFGKNLSLLQCEQDTRRWLKENALRLMKMRTQLISVLSKYENVKEPAVIKGKRLPEEMHLRNIMTNIVDLKNRLAVHRPKQAAKFQL